MKMYFPEYELLVQCNRNIHGDSDFRCNKLSTLYKRLVAEVIFELKTTNTTRNVIETIIVFNEILWFNQVVVG